MAQKVSDLAVRTGTKPDGKGRYKNIGSVMQGDNGQFLIIDRTFNPAGVPNPDNRDSVLVSVFEPRQSQGQPQATGQQYAQASQGGQQPAGGAGFDEMDDSIPF